MMSMRVFSVVFAQVLAAVLLLAPPVAAQQIASLEHDTSNGNNNGLVQVDQDTFALAYTDGSDDGWIRTFTISSDGTTITEEDSLEHDIEHGSSGSLVQVDADTYALAYSGVDNHGFIKTFDLSAVFLDGFESGDTGAW